VGFRLRLDYWANPADVPDAASTIGDAAIRPSVSEDFDDLSLDPASPSYYVKRANGFNSSLVQVSAADDAEAPIGDGVSGRLDAGTDGHPLTAADYEGDDADPVRRRGLKALELDRFREVAIVYAPGVDYDTARLVVTHCERIRFRLAVVDSLSGEANAVRIEPREQVTDTKYGAFYYPWIYVTDPRSGVRTKVPPGGPVCGIYALTDNTRGVFKAPANESLAGAVELEFDVNQGSQGILNARGVNVIRRFPGRGIRLGGARTMSSNPLWQYVNVRRLFIFLEASIYLSTQWVVFEPNDPRLWARVKQTVTHFLRTLWLEGALLGLSEQEAFSVAVGSETMTEDDLLNGHLIVEIGVAPVRPAEFVVFRSSRTPMRRSPDRHERRHRRGSQVAVELPLGLEADRVQGRAGGGELFGRGAVAQRAVRPVGVVDLHPGIQRLLRRLRRPPLALEVIEELRAHRLVQPLHLPRRGRRVRRGQQVRDPVLVTHPVEPHQPRRAHRPAPARRGAAGEHLPVVGEHLLGHPGSAELDVSIWEAWHVKHANAVEFVGAL
jgi:hypothetical protein